MGIEFRSRDEKRCIMRTSWEPVVHYEEVLVDGKPVSHAALIQLDMRIGSSRVKMGGIAGVGTEPEHRMKGYARTCMTRTIQYMLNHGYDISMLFGISGFYTKFGYATCLPTHTLTLRVRDAEKAPRRSEYEVRDFTENDIDSVLKIFNKDNRRRTCTVVRKKDEWRGFRPGSRPGYPPPAFVLEKEDRVVAYVAFHRYMNPDRDIRPPYDSQFLVTELGAESPEPFSTILNELAARAIKMRFERISLSLPLDHPFVEYSHRLGSESVIGYPKDGGGMMRIINQKELFNKIKDELQRRVAESKITEGSVEIKTELDSTKFKVKDGELYVTEGKGKERNMIELPQSILTQLVVGYRSVEDLVNDDRVNVRGNIKLLQALFPKSPPYSWILDHF